jgi:hypothetical protein
LAALPARLQGLRNGYDTALKRIAAEYDARSNDLKGRYAQNLELLEKKLTAQGDIAGALAVREERQHLKPAPAHAPEPPDKEPWCAQWKMVGNWSNDGGPGLSFDKAWAAGEMLPGAYENVPPVDLEKARRGILGMHPPDPKIPAAIRFEGSIPPAKPVLSCGSSRQQARRLPAPLRRQRPDGGRTGPGRAVMENRPVRPGEIHG